jgi:hypothetical protein
MPRRPVDPSFVNSHSLSQAESQKKMGAHAPIGSLLPYFGKPYWKFIFEPSFRLIW